MMKDYKARYERMDARRKAKLDEMVQLEESLIKTANEIEELEEDIKNAERELADLKEAKMAYQIEYTKLYNEAERKRMLECITTKIKRMFLVSTETNTCIESGEKVTQTKKISALYDEYRYTERRKDISEQEREKILTRLQKQIADETDVFFSMHN